MKFYNQQKKLFGNVFHGRIDQSTLNLWLNYLLVSYAFLLPINDYARAFLFSVIIILILIRGSYKAYFMPVLNNPVVIAFIAFFLIYLAGMLWTENVKEGLALVKRVQYALFLPLFLSFIDKRFSLTIISAFLGGMLFSELISYAIYFGIIPAQFMWKGIDLYRSYAVGDPSPFLHHSHYGMALALSVSILIFRLTSTSLPVWQKVLWSFFIITMTTNLLITGGRIGYLMYGVLILLSLYFALGKKMLKPAVGVIVVVGIVGSLGYKTSPLFEKRINETILSAKHIMSDPMNFTTSMGNRLGLWHYSANVIAENLIIGVGTGDGRDETHKYIPQKDAFLKGLTHFHNQYIEVFVSLGIVGVFIFLNMFVQIFRVKHERRELHASMVLVTVAIAFALATETFNMKFYLPLWVVFLAATMATATRIEGEHPKTTSEIKIYVGLVFLALIVGKLQ